MFIWGLGGALRVLVEGTMESYLDVTVRISAENEARPEGDASRPAQYRVFVESQQGQGESRLVLPFALRELAGIVFGVAETARDLERGPAPVNERSPREYGELLYEALFTGSARTILDKTIAVAGERQTGVRIRLSMDLKGQGMTDVASLPWELMCPRDDSPLVVSTKTALVRSLDLQQRTEPTK